MVVSLGKSHLNYRGTTYLRCDTPSEMIPHPDFYHSAGLQSFWKTAYAPHLAVRTQYYKPIINVLISEWDDLILAGLHRR